MNIQTEKSAGGIVYKKAGGNVTWLVTQHSTNKHWSFPKGLIGDTNKNESMKEAALREVEEEGGIKAKIVNDEPVTVNYTYRNGDILVKKTVHYFLMECISGDPKNHDWEVSEAKFVPVDEVSKIVTYSSDKKAFQKILKFQ